jgi:hypothetical protein
MKANESKNRVKRKQQRSETEANESMSGVKRKQTKAKTV